METRTDELVRWVTLATVLAVAALLLSVGIFLYAKPPPGPHGGTAINQKF